MKVLGIFNHPEDEMAVGWPIFQRAQIEKRSLILDQLEGMEQEIAQSVDEFRPHIVFTYNQKQNREVFDKILGHSKVKRLLIADSADSSHHIFCRASCPKQECSLYFVKSAGFHRKEVLDMITAISQEGECVGAEIGVYKGATCLYLSQQPHIKRIYAIDPWEDIEGYTDHKKLLRDISRHNTHGPSMKAKNWESLYIEVSELLSQQSNIVVLRDYSALVCDAFEDGSLNFVFIDGDHSYESVYFDIEAWTPKLKDKGIIAGHDFTWTGDGGSKRALVTAVHDFFEADADLFCEVLDPARNAFINRADDRVWWQQRRSNEQT